MTTAGFIALAAPHTVILPTMLAIINDIEKHCTQKNCLLETPHWQWFIFPTLVLPLDGLTLAYNLRTLPDDKLVIGASAWSCASASLVFIWGLVSGMLIYSRRRTISLNQKRGDNNLLLVSGDVYGDGDVSL